MKGLTDLGRWLCQNNLRGVWTFLLTKSNDYVSCVLSLRPSLFLIQGLRENKKREMFEDRFMLTFLFQALIDVLEFVIKLFTSTKKNF